MECQSETVPLSYKSRVPLVVVLGCPADAPHMACIYDCTVDPYDFHPIYVPDERIPVCTHAFQTEKSAARRGQATRVHSLNNSDAVVRSMFGVGESCGTA